MKRVSLIIMLIISVLSFVHCPAFFSLNKKESKLYTKEQTVILEKTTKALDYDFAYDPDTNLDYIFDFSRTKKDAAKNENEFIKVADSIKLETFINFYEKIFTLKLLTLLKLEEYKSDESWKYTTYIEKHLLPPLNNYLSILEKYVVNKDKVYGKALPVRKKAILKELLLHLETEQADIEFEEGYYN